MIDLAFREAEITFSSVSPDVVIRVIARVLDRLIDINERARCQTVEVITKFHSLYAPDVSLENYLQRIKKYANCSISCFVIALIYIDRLIAKQGLAISRLNIHRLLITSVMIAIKFHEDDYYKNTFYAKLGGLSLEPLNGNNGSEINILERELLSYLEFHCMVDTVVYNRYMRELTNWSQTHSPVHGPYASSALCQSSFPVPAVIVNPYSNNFTNCHNNSLYVNQTTTYPINRYPPQSAPMYQNNIWQQPMNRVSPIEMCQKTNVIGPYTMLEVPNNYQIPQRDPSPRGVDQLLWAENIVNYPLQYVNINYSKVNCTTNPYGAVGQSDGKQHGKQRIIY